MRTTRNVLKVSAVSAALALVGSGVSYAALVSAEPDLSSTDGANDSAVVASHANHKHGGQAGHLDGSSTPNMRLVGQMRINQDQAGRVADVAVHNGHAYVAAFYEPNCQKGGVYVFDIRNPEAPKQINFIRTANDSYAGEGSQALRISTPAFTGDLLIHNNEICAGGGMQRGTSHAVGGISLVDVTNPKTHQVLASGFGDVRTGMSRANQVHSAFAWQPSDSETAYAVMVDNEEATDVDIVDISDPRQPVIIAEYDLNNGTKVVDGVTEPSGIDPVADDVKGESESFIHDMVVKEIDGRQVMLVSYWDGGYVTLNVDDPRNATYIGDSDFAAHDEQMLEEGEQVEPEGNAHQAEFSGDNRYIFAADEDFNPYGFEASGKDIGEFAASSGDGTVQLPAGSSLSGETRYVGRACTGDLAVPPASAAGQLALVERGICTFTEKVANVAAAGGYGGVVIFNRDGSDACTATLGMSVTGSLPTFGVIGRDVAFALLGLPYDDAACEAAEPQQTLSEPYTPITGDAALGTLGEEVEFTSYFDGWGYLRLFENGKGKLKQLDTYAIPEAHDPDFATGFGDLSVHEVAFSEKKPHLAYVSYYSGGTRVYDVSRGTIEEVGHYIAPDGSNMWGVEVFQGTDGKEYVAASDRDFGVQIFEVTGEHSPNAIPAKGRKRP